MKPVVTELKISKEDMDSFLAFVVTDDIGGTFVRLAAQFLPFFWTEIEKRVQKLMEAAPLTARIGRRLMADEHVAAKIGSVEDDPFGRLVEQTKRDF
jgi:hypothetical protein